MPQRAIHAQPPAAHRSTASARGTRLAKRPSAPYLPGMVTRTDIIWLGLSAAVAGSITGGLLLGIGLGLAVQGAHIGWVLILPAAPIAGGIGWLLARRLARQLPG